MAYLGFGKGEPWQSPWSGGQGGEAETLFASECSMETANSPIFVKFDNAKDHQTLLNFAVFAGKRQKNAPFYIKSPVKNFHGRAKRGASHRGPLNTPLTDVN